MAQSTPATEANSTPLPLYKRGTHLRCEFINLVTQEPCCRDYDYNLGIPVPAPVDAASYNLLGVKLCRHHFDYIRKSHHLYHYINDGDEHEAFNKRVRGFRWRTKPCELAHKLRPKQDLELIMASEEESE